MFAKYDFSSHLVVINLYSFHARTYFDVYKDAISYLMSGPRNLFHRAVVVREQKGEIVTSKLHLHVGVVPWFLFQQNLRRFRF